MICGASNKRFEVVEFAETLKTVNSVMPQILTYAPNPEYREVFRSTIAKEPIVVKPIRDTLDFKTNWVTFKGIVLPYVVEMSKRL